MTVQEYIQHHGLKRVSDATFFPPVFQHKFKLGEDVEYYADAPSPNRLVGICKDRNYAAVFRTQNQSLTNVNDLTADIPDLNKST
jgi:hypothetical protein